MVLHPFPTLCKVYVLINLWHSYLVNSSPVPVDLGNSSACSTGIFVQSVDASPIATECHRHQGRMLPIKYSLCAQAIYRLRHDPLYPDRRRVWTSSNPFAYRSWPSPDSTCIITIGAPRGGLTAEFTLADIDVALSIIERHCPEQPSQFNEGKGGKAWFRTQGVANPHEGWFVTIYMPDHRPPPSFNSIFLPNEQNGTWVSRTLPIAPELPQCSAQSESVERKRDLPRYH